MQTLKETILNIPMGKDLKEEFNLSYGVDASFDKYWIFKYDLLCANWNTPVTHECRGTIMSIDGSEVRYLSRPFDKFFNQSETHCSYKTRSDLESLIRSNAYLSQKCDGTCIQLWYDPSSLKWRASTLGTINTLNCNDNPFTFGELFFKMFKCDWSKLRTDVTYIFELCSVYNQIVTSYASDRIYILGARVTSTGEYIDNDELETLFLNSNVMFPERIYLNTLAIFSWDDLYNYIESNVNPEHGNNPEGWVICSENGRPLCKLKRKTYLALHHTMSGNNKFVRKVLVKMFFDGIVDDVYKDLTEAQREFVDRLKSTYIHVVHDLRTALEAARAYSVGDRRKFYEGVLEQAKTSEVVNVFSYYITSHFEKNEDVSEWFVQTVNSKKHQELTGEVRQRYEMYMDFFKAV